MKKIWILPMFILTFFLSGCFNDPIQEDMLNYVNKEMEDVIPLELSAIEAYEAVTGSNYTDDYALYDTLTYEVIPTYKEFIAELEDVNVETDDLRNIHEGYIEGANLQYNAFVKILSALEQQDSAMIEEANQMLDQARKMMRDYNHELEKLAKEHKVELTDLSDATSL